MIGGGFMQDMVVKSKENLSRLPSNKKGQRQKFMESKRPKCPYKQNSQKLEYKKLSESELEEVINRIRLDAQKERRKRMLFLPVKILITILMFIVFILLVKKFCMWYFPKSLWH